MYTTKAGDIVCKREVGHIAVIATATVTAAAFGVEMQTGMGMRLGALHDHTSEVGIKRCSITVSPGLAVLAVLAAHICPVIYRRPSEVGQ